MNTPAHAIFNLLVLRGAGKAGARNELILPVAVGAVLPDLPMVWFYFYQRVLVGLPEQVIWGEAYYRDWQVVFDLFNSLPLLAVLSVGAFLLGARRLGFLAASMGIHSLADLPLHNDDAHRHLYPLSDWRFESPISYWDPSHYGLWIALAEIVMVSGGGLYLLRGYPAGRNGRLGRGIVGTVVALYIGYLVFVVVVWV